jgi:hypothetical protein
LAQYSGDDFVDARLAASDDAPPVIAAGALASVRHLRTSSREREIMDIVYRLPRFEYTNSLVPYASYDQEPEYMIVGGLVFQPLTDAYLQSWGQDWKSRAPFRLNYYNNESPAKDRPALLMLSQVLPDPYTIGYQDQRWLVLNKVNGQRVSRLPELRDALQKPLDGYHVLEFVKGEGLQRMVLAAREHPLQRVLAQGGRSVAQGSRHLQGRDVQP